MKKVKKTISILLCLLLLGGILSETGMQGGILPQTVQAAGRYTGWKTVSGKRYYYQNGRMLKGMSKIGNDYYCFNYQGVQLKGWVYTKNHYRYFDKRSGKMRRNTTIQGRKINSNGVWVPVVVLDPGHSGVQMSGYEPLGPGSSERKAKCSSGTEGVATGIGEYQLTLNIAKKLRIALIAQGCRVIMTRNDNKTRISCAQRAGVANRAKADAYLRIHANGVDYSSVNGAMTICVTSRNRYVSRSMYRKSYALSKAVLNSYVKATGCRKEYIWETDSMSGNNWSKVPTTLIELGYMSNPSEDRMMQRLSYQQKMVKGMADGIKKFFIS